MLFLSYHYGIIFFKFFCFKFIDPEYKQFLETYSMEEERTSANPELLLEEIEAKTRELVGLFSSFLLFSLWEYFIYRVCIFSFSQLWLEAW